MEVLDWLNENSLRGFPLLEDTDKRATNAANYIIPDSLLVDLLLVSAAPVDVTYLDQITISSTGHATVRFSTNDVFEIASVSSQTYPVYVRNPTGSLAVFGDGLKALPIPASGTTTFALLAEVEPATVVEFRAAWLGVSSIGVLPNIDAYASIKYAPVVSPLQTLSTPTPRLSGDVQMRAGYNFRIGITDNLINLQVRAGLGLQADCTTFFVVKSLLDCDQLVSYINGVPPDDSGKILLAPGANIHIIDGRSLDTSVYDTIEHVPANAHTLFVGLTFLQTDVCAPVTLTPEVNA